MSYKQTYPKEAASPRQAAADQSLLDLSHTLAPSDRNPMHANPNIVEGMPLTRTFQGIRGRTTYVYTDSDTGQEYYLYGPLNRTVI